MYPELFDYFVRRSLGEALDLVSGDDPEFT
jgi:hypothetical protein